MEKWYIVNLAPILSILVGCKLHYVGQSKGIFSIVHRLWILCSSVGKKKAISPWASVPFWEGRNTLQQSAVQTQQPGVPLAMKLLEKPTGRWHKPSCKTKTPFPPCTTRCAQRCPVVLHNFSS